MSKNLIIVESPTKTKTISKVLGKDFEVMASKGHLRDLPKSQFGVDIEKNFTPKYINVRGKGKTINALKKAAKNADNVYLATDPDREGEAISWHLSYLLDLDEEENNRVTFQEITPTGIKEGMKNPRKIDQDLVDAQQARRVMDRIVGYEISPLLWKRVKGGLSAGRVQSVALKLIVDRQRAIDAFIPEEYWTIHAQFTKDALAFEAEFFARKGEKKATITNEKEADAILSQLTDTFLLERIEKKNRSRRAPAPFTTSTLQQEASNRLGFSTSKTMMVAQQLYEGISVGKEGQVGLITYMRTDSTRLSGQFTASAKKYIDRVFGKEYSSSSASGAKTKAGAQDAHEAIRPTEVMRSPDEMKQYLSNDQFRLYDLIWRRAMASRMKSASFLSTTFHLLNNGLIFRANGILPKFDGYQKVWPVKDNTVVLPEAKENELFTAERITKNQHFTQPPPRYTEASLVKTLEENGIGRPSTYSSIIKSLLSRNYAKLDKKAFEPTELGFIVYEFLEKNFSDIINEKFTARMEEYLDDVAEGKKAWKVLMKDFYDVFSDDMQKAKEDEASYKVTPKEVGEDCPTCGKPLLYRQGRNGEFIGCSGFPECNYTRSIIKSTGIICPKCKSGQIIERISKRGRLFYGCSSYPDCDYASWDKPTGENCPLCGDLMVHQKNRRGERTYCHNEECPNHDL